MENLPAPSRAPSGSDGVRGSVGSSQRTPPQPRPMGLRAGAKAGSCVRGKVASMEAVSDPMVEKGRQEGN